MSGQRSREENPRQEGEFVDVVTELTIAYRRNFATGWQQSVGRSLLLTRSLQLPQQKGVRVGGFAVLLRARGADAVAGVVVDAQ